MLKFEHFWKCTPEIYSPLFKFLNTPLSYAIDVNSYVVGSVNGVVARCGPHFSRVRTRLLWQYIRTVETNNQSCVGDEGDV